MSNQELENYILENWELIETETQEILRLVGVYPK
jgi:hypothetical protein